MTGCATIKKGVYDRVCFPSPFSAAGGGYFGFGIREGMCFRCIRTELYVGVSNVLIRNLILESICLL